MELVGLGLSQANVTPLYDVFIHHSWLCCCPRVPAPLQLPKLMELVGLGYSSWFTYRYLLFKVRS